VAGCMGLTSASLCTLVRSITLVPVTLQEETTMSQSLCCCAALAAQVAMSLGVLLWRHLLKDRVNSSSAWCSMRSARLPGPGSLARRLCMVRCLVSGNVRAFGLMHIPFEMHAGAHCLTYLCMIGGSCLVSV